MVDHITNHPIILLQTPQHRTSRVLCHLKCSVHQAKAKFPAVCRHKISTCTDAANLLKSNTEPLIPLQLKLKILSVIMFVVMSNQNTLWPILTIKQQLQLHSKNCHFKIRIIPIRHNLITTGTKLERLSYKFTQIISSSFRR